MGDKNLSKPCRFPFYLVGIFLCALLAGFVFSRPASLSHAATIGQPDAESWHTVIFGHSALPPYKVVVDKSRQQLFFFERHSPLKLSRVFFGTTGQAVGDKLVEGDLKTPEGVYFVVHRIGSGLDFVRFGTEAYTLNYPNPVDRLRRKTGHGIWIHGRGEPLVPLQTEGCVAMDNDELALLGKLLTPGTPVVMTESFTVSLEENKEQAAIVDELRQKVKDWAAAWSARSSAYFDFYDKQAYSIAQREPFSAFQANKERLFKLLPWIRTTASHIQILEGPGYWVTWFFQDYQAPNLKTRGVRRLYWVRDGEEFKIVGMEWLPGLRTSSTLVASSSPLLPPLETPFPAVIPNGWIVADADTPGSYGVLAAAEGRLGMPVSASPILTVLSSPADNVSAESVPFTDTSPVIISDSGADAVLPAAESGEDSKTGADSVVLALAEGVSRQSTDHVENPSLGVIAHPSQEAVRLAREERLRQRSGQTDDVRVAVNESYGQGAMTLPPPLPSQGLAESSQASQAQHMSARALGEPQQEPQPADVQTPSSEELASRIIATVESWRAAWEQGDLESYMSYYVPTARQGFRRNAAAIRRQKEELWNRIRPASVLLEDIRVSVKGDAAQVVMRQRYTDESGNGDFGRKTLSFILKDGAWLITQEEWSALPYEISN